MVGREKHRDESTAKETPESHAPCAKFPSPLSHVDFFDSRVLLFCSNSTSIIVVVRMKMTPGGSNV